MVESIPTFQLKVTEGMIDVDTSVDKLFCYCIEATRGPVLQPTLVASQTEAQRIFGVDFAPHFYQKPTGLLIIRVGFEGMEKASLTYKAAQNPDGTGNKVDFLKIESVDPGEVDYTVNIGRSLTSDGFNLSIKIGDITSKSYQGLPTIRSVVKQINTKFSQFLKATFVTDTTNAFIDSFKKEQLEIKASPSDRLSGGSNGYLLTTEGSKSDKKIGADGEFPTVTKTGGTEQNPEYAAADANPEKTYTMAYRKAFAISKERDVVGVATLSDQEVVQNELIEHINQVTDPEVAQLRFGVTGYLDYEANKDTTNISVQSLYQKAVDINNEYIIYIGQGVKFTDEKGNTRDLYPHECVQLYTGIRSALGYSEAIFGGEQKKVLAGVTDVLPVITNKSDITKEDIEELNEHGVCTFKKEYNEVTFLEGVTTTQDHDVLSYESIMSIVLYVTKRLIRIAKPYQGQNLNEDLKSSLQTALSNELKSIVETDGTLVALEDYNIPPYDVSVKSAAVTTFNEAGELVRESKIIIQCKIVPIGALRDIDLGVIVI